MTELQKKIKFVLDSKISKKEVESIFEHTKSLKEIKPEFKEYLDLVLDLTELYKHQIYMTQPKSASQEIYFIILSIYARDFKKFEHIEYKRGPFRDNIFELTDLILRKSTGPQILRIAKLHKLIQTVL